MQRTRFLGLFVPLSLALAASCAPTFSERPSQITGPRILAARAEPAETKPGDAVTYDALVVGLGGTQVGAPTAWAFCVTPKLVAENDAVSPGCLQDNGVSQIASTPDIVKTVTPGNTCSLFGPEVPADSDLRPRDPDPTGGFYQPVRVRTNDDVAFGLFRTTCALANAPGDVVTDFTTKYVVNANPHIASVVRIDAGAESPFTSATQGETVAVRVHWPDADAEHYAYFDPTSVSIVDRRESMRVSFYGTAGSFDLDASGQGEADLPTYADNTWHAPAVAGAVHTWFVLRDSRGGVAFTGVDVDVK
jgi:hypothetical protein